MTTKRITQIPTAPMLADDILLSGAEVFFRIVDDSKVLLTANVFLISMIFFFSSAAVMLFELVIQTQVHDAGTSVV
jgi:hypothetical protein